MLPLAQMIVMASEGEAVAHAGGIPSLQSIVWSSLGALLLVVTWFIRQWVESVRLEQQNLHDKLHKQANTIQEVVLNLKSLELTAATNKSVQDLELRLTKALGEFKDEILAEVRGIADSVKPPRRK